SARVPFHLAIPVDDLDAARTFYVEVLGAGVGRTDARWIDFDLAGHQVTAHLVDAEVETGPTNEVDARAVPVRHFGLVLPWEEWHARADALRARDTDFLVAPHLRFEGKVGEQATMFFRDPAGNAIELKSFRDPAQLFATDDQ
ncbi:MAG: VOC family protein, partial [Myxococcota bacterium]